MGQRGQEVVLGAVGRVGLRAGGPLGGEEVAVADGDGRVRGQSLADHLLALAEGPHLPAGHADQPLDTGVAVDRHHQQRAAAGGLDHRLEVGLATRVVPHVGRAVRPPGGHDPAADAFAGADVDSRVGANFITISVDRKIDPPANAGGTDFNATGAS